MNSKPWSKMKSSTKLLANEDDRSGSEDLTLSLSSDVLETVPAEQPRPPVVSSKVAFYPPSETLWRIGGKWYDFTPFLPLHPGGAEILLLARDRFEDSTYAFESHPSLADYMFIVF